jgi:ubiquinone biosynthesis protein COQ9
VSQIEDGSVKSAILTDKNQTIQIVTKSGAHYQANWVGNQGQQLATELQKNVPPEGYNVVVPSGNSVLG